MLKAAFWISVAVIVLPLVTDGPDGNAGYPADYEPEPVHFSEAATMVQDVAGDLMSFCDREPGACETSRRLLWTARVTATDIAGKAYDWLRQGPTDADEGDS